MPISSRLCLRNCGTAQRTIRPYSQPAGGIRGKSWVPGQVFAAVGAPFGRLSGGDWPVRGDLGVAGWGGAPSERHDYRGRTAFPPQTGVRGPSLQSQRPVLVAHGNSGRPAGNSPLGVEVARRAGGSKEERCIRESQAAGIPLARIMNPEPPEYRELTTEKSIAIPLLKWLTFCRHHQAGARVGLPAEYNSPFLRVGG